jgi:peptidoglycan/xylan/chitin deacetylase (PgdA/CDA1 family)
MDIEALRVRREQRRLEIRRRRRRAAAALGLGLIAAAVIVLVALRSAGGPSGSSRGSASASVSAHRHGPTRRGQTRGTNKSRDGTVKADAPSGPPGTDAVPILMYHVIAAAPVGAPYPGLYVPPAEFAEQMLALKQAGWHAVTLDQVEAYWRHGVGLGAGKPIVLSFDNGYQSQYTQALPTLRRFDWVGDENLQLTGLPPSQGGLGQQEIRGLVKAGWELDTQGFSHADLTTLDTEQLHYQVAVARRVVQQRYRVPVNWFCYPSGQYNATVIAAAKAAGYTGSTTVVPGWAHPSDDPYRLHRLRVLGGTTGATLLAQLAGDRTDPPAPDAYET